ncbi:hypothetical protein J3F83DRAFT_764555 [Trichoderma novae-zelandiae]
MPTPKPGTYVPSTTPFEPPYYFRISQSSKWNKATDEMQGDELLWRTYWKRFNTVQIPILPQDDFFETALSIAKLAGGRQEDFERIFEERNKKRWAEVLSQMGKTRFHAECHKEAFPCEDAREKMIRVCRTGCLTHFLDILKGNTFGYEADVIRDEPLDNAPNSLREEEAEFLKKWESEYLDADGFPRSQRYNFDPDIEFYEDPPAKDWRDPLMADNVFYIGSYTCEHASPQLNDGAEAAPNPETGRTSSMSPLLSSRTPTPQKGEQETTAQTRTQRKRKRKTVRFDDAIDVDRPRHQQQFGPEDGNDDDGHAHKRPKLEASASHASSIIQPATDKGASRKRTRQDHDHDDGQGRQKRQKLKTPTTSAPTPDVSPPVLATTKARILRRRTRHSDGRNHGHKSHSLEDPAACLETPPASSSPPGTDSAASRKRARQSDDHDNGFKRQKLENPAACNPQSQATSSTQQMSDEKSDTQDGDRCESPKRRKSSTRQSRKRPSPPPSSLNTRSTRGSRPSAFLELDRSGKPRSI